MANKTNHSNSFSSGNQTEKFFEAFSEQVGRISTSNTFEEFLLRNVYMKDPTGPKPYGFKGFAYLKQIVRESQNHPYLVFLKAAQIAYSTFALARLVWKIYGTSLKAGIYFPDDTSMKDFVQDRVDPFIHSCPLLRNDLNQVDNTRVKKIGQATLALRGTWTKRGVKTIDLDIVMLDEVDEHNEENIEFVGDRLLRSQLNWMMLGSQPSVPDMGIHKEFMGTDQRHWLIKCGYCNHWNDLLGRFLAEQTSIFGFKFESNTDFPMGSVFYKCEKCGRRLNNQKGEYVAKRKHDKRGYQVSQMWTELDPTILYKKYLQCDSSAKRKNFWISYIGYPYSSDEEKPLNLEQLSQFQGDFGLKDSSEFFTYFGADQGDIVYGVFGEPTHDGRIKIIGLYKGHILEEEKISRAIENFNVFAGILDAMPNRNWSLRMALRFPENLKIQFFSKKYSENSEDIPGDEMVEVIKVNRDESLQDTVDAIKNGLFVFPNSQKLSSSDLKLYEEFKFHLTMLIREKSEDENGKTLWKFKKKVENHFGMALNSLRLAAETNNSGGYFVSPFL